MRYTCTLTILLSLLSGVLWAQQNNAALEDVVILKNGSILRGQLLTLNPNSNLRIRILGGSELVYPFGELDSMYKAPLWSMVQTRNGTKFFAEKQLPKRGWMAEINMPIPLHGTFSDRAGLSSSYGLSFNTGYRFNQHYGLSFGLGINTYPWFLETFSPVYVRSGGDILKKAITPTYLIDVGYGIAWSRNNLYDGGYLAGGAFVQAGFGVKFNTRRRAAYSLLFTYSYQQYTTTAYDYYIDVVSYYAPRESFGHESLRLIWVTSF